MMKYYVCQAGYCEVSAWEEGAWTNISCPTEKEIQYLTDELNVPLSFLNDIADNEERPRVEYEADWRLVILRVPCRSVETPDFFITIPLGVLTNDKHFITVCYHKTEMVDDFILYSQRKGFENKQPNDLLLHMLLSSSVWFMKYLKLINLETKEVEKHLSQSIRNEELLELMRLERTLVYFITSIQGNEVLARKLQNLLNQGKAPYDTTLLEDVEIELHQARTMTNVHSDILSGMMDAFASVISNNLNVMMKRLTSASIILMIPTLIASFYGMNVPNALENNVNGFLIIGLTSVLISIIAVFIFLRKKWF